MEINNNVNLIGNLTADPILIGGNAKYCYFNLATNKKYTDKKTGELVDKVSYHSCLISGKMAETICKYAKKGTKVALSCEIFYKSKSIIGADTKKYNYQECTLLVNRYIFL